MLEETDKHLQNLPVREYAVITCLYINEMSVKETAKELGIKPNTVDVYKRQGMTCIPTPLAVYAQEPEEYTVILDENFESELSAGVKLSGGVSVVEMRCV